MVKVSLVSSIYNREDYLEKCIKSMLSQTFSNIEIILLNNASVDNSQKIIDRYAQQYPQIIKGYSVKENLGAGGGRSKGMSYATGDYICFIDSDDYILPSYIEDCLQGIDRCSSLPDLIISDFVKVDTHGAVLYHRKYKNEGDALYQSIAPWGKLFKRTYLEQNNLTLRNIPFAEDVIFTAEVIMTKPHVRITAACGYCWLLNSSSTSNVTFRGFPSGTLDKAFEYFRDIRDHRYGDTELLTFFSYKYVVWYLLHSGRNSGKVKMLEQYENALSYLDKDFPKYKNCRYISLFRPKEERFVVRLAVWGIHVLSKCKLDRVFLSIYSRLKVDKFWPKL